MKYFQQYHKRVAYKNELLSTSNIYLNHLLITLKCPAFNPYLIEVTQIIQQGIE